MSGWIVGRRAGALLDRHATLEQDAKLRIRGLTRSNRADAGALCVPTGHQSKQARPKKPNSAPTESASTRNAWASRVVEYICEIKFTDYQHIAYYCDISYCKQRAEMRDPDRDGMPDNAAPASHRSRQLPPIRRLRTDPAGDSR